ncbi:2-amino-4-hydroxy-6-hydroxymethyldihydropteridine diphosphokinase [Paracoccus sp. (in: a-proteobacteria)]|uniref:2-amino-4-hydroxy-6- hydroxymethyldihydropteridine diphosphokinase n=1 Tax=Paracoccus sp. TaxID=267 RepID=UPI0026DF8B94|nr:2-amino-4-hydroxy-6-hydroxymethyldihydropteridine diphosphokinase [Paracoccus sp. (in: a-proteobacteria)]MDO5646933.1 2-amino-4-hydroxy-6-hydroxymethyldihydropteridine diphosphokinase [Paracoccus sp. (in: a-proteobacteria)]
MRNLSFGLVALGCNLASGATSLSATLRQALHVMQDPNDVTITAISRFWRTPAYPAGAGPDFVNAAIALKTQLSADDFLARLHGIESDAGRDRSAGRWASRVLDLDLIAFDDVVLPDAATQRDWVNLPAAQQAQIAPDRLILPHPRMQDRGFVLAPLADIAPDWRHPVTGRSVAQMLADLPPGSLDGIEPLRDCS